LLEIILPLQLLAALGSRQRIVWREHVMQVERGGTFHFVRRVSRSSAESVGD
jgi:ceramide glucosyltransferase